MSNSSASTRIAIGAANMILCIAIVAGPAKADTERPNTARVTAGEPFGRCYARSVPHDNYLQKGVTQVYQVTAGAEDKLLFTFDWYSKQVHLYCNPYSSRAPKLSLVRLGKWPRGSQPSADELAIEFYYGGKLVGSHSTLDIAGGSDKIRRSVSHYEVIDKILGYNYSDEFRVTTFDGGIITFDTRTGQLTERIEGAGAPRDSAPPIIKKGDRRSSSTGPGIGETITAVENPDGSRTVIITDRVGNIVSTEKIP